MRGIHQRSTFSAASSWKTPRPLRPAAFLGMLLLVFTSLTTHAQVPDLTNGGVVPDWDWHSFNVGPTGLRGWAYHVKTSTDQSRQIYVKSSDAGSPADGIMSTGDVILGADGSGGEPSLFSSDARISIANAINDAEARSPATLKLLRWRAGVTTTVTLTLETMGTYSPTAPYNCEKSRNILAKCLPAAAALTDPGWNNLQALVLLAANDPSNPSNAVYQAKARTWARAHIMGAAEIEKRKGPEHPVTSPWDDAYKLLILTEYYMQTQDPDVYPSLEALAICFARNHGCYGTTSHTYGSKWPGGGDNGPVASYGAINASGVAGFIGMVLAREAGVENDYVNAGIERSAGFFGSYSGRGTIPYGENPPGLSMYDMNGKCGTAALAFSKMPDRTEEARYFAKMSTLSHSERDESHAGPYFNNLWPPLGAALLGEEAAAYYFSKTRWLFDLSRRWDGGISYDGYGNDAKGKYWAFAQTPTVLLTYALPLRQLHITGRNHPSSLELSTAELDEVKASGAFNAWSCDTNALLAALSDWSPIVRNAAAYALGTSPEGPAVLGTLHAMAMDTAAGPASRSAACTAMQEIADGSSAPILAQLLTDGDAIVRYAAAKAMRYMPNKYSYLDTILQATVSTIKPNFPFPEDDPIQVAHAELANLLFYAGNVYGPKGILSAGLTAIAGMDRNVLVPVFRAILGAPMGGERSLVSFIYPSLTYDEFLEISDSIFQAAGRLAPADCMFGAPAICEGNDLFLKFNIAEGVPMARDINFRYREDGMYLLRGYAGACLTIDPDPKIIDYLNTYSAERSFWLADSTRTIILTDTDPISVTPLKRIDSLVADSTTLSFPQKSTMLHVQATNYVLRAPDASIYTWRKVSGPGDVHFSSNGTPQSKDIVAYFKDGIPGVYTLEVTMTDSIGYTLVRDRIAITLRDASGNLPANTAPAATSQSFTVTTPGVPVPFTLAGSDPQGDPLSYEVVDPPQHGTLSGDVPYLSYTADFGYTGVDTFSFTVTDSQSLTSTGTVSVTVSPGNVGLSVYEPFDYPTGLLDGRSGTSEIGLTGSWTVPDHWNCNLVADSFSYPLLPSKGNTVYGVTVQNGGTVTRSLDPDALLNAGLLADGGEIWISVYVGINDDINWSNAYLEFGLMKDGAPETAQVGMRFEPHETAYAKIKNVKDWEPYYPEDWSGYLWPPKQPNLVVIRCKWGDSPGEPDTVEVYRMLYKNGRLFPYNNVISTASAVMDQTALNTLYFNRYDHLWLDEIRVGPTYESVIAGTVAAPEDVTPPGPGPMVIASAVPGPDGTSATLTAVPVYDERGVEYAFTCTSGNGHDSGWQESNVYSDTGLTPGETYTYTVTARDRSPARNETSPSMPVQLTLPATVTMPSLAGLPESHAVQFLQSLNLTTSTVTLAHTGTLPDGFVFSHTPSTGLQAPIGSAVALVVEDNQIPVADSQSVTTAEDTAKAITLTGSDADGDALTYIILTPPAHGTLSGTAPNVTYTPAANYYGSDAFTFKVNAGALDSSPATVSLTVTSVNDLPTVALTAPASGSVYTPPAAMTLTATAADLDGTIAKVEFFNGASLIGTDTTSPYSFTWSDVAAGTYTLSAKATDNEGGLQASASVNVTVNEFDLPFFDGFELSNLRSLEGQNGWTANGAEVQTSDAFAGSNAVTIDSEDGFVKHTFAVGETSVWTDMRIKPVFSVRVMPAPANASAAFFFNMSGNPVVYDGATPVTLSGTAISAGQWVRVSIHSDYVAKTWDLYIDGVEVQAGIGFHAAAATGYRSVKVDNGSETFGTKLDNVSVGITVPNFSPNIVPTADAGTDQTVTDADGDGSESVTLDGSASTDSDGTITGYVWKEGATQIATGVSPTVSLAVGAHTITLTVTDNDGATDTATVNVTVNAAPTGGAYEQNAQGLISIEAEHYTAKMDAAEEAWTEITDSNASGGVAMDSTPDDGVSIAGEARMDYRVNFVKTGTHYIWVRGRAWPRTGGVGNADSLHMGVDGAIADTADKITGFNTSYAWSRSTMDGPVATITVTSTGVHDVNVFVREDGFVCDKIVLTTDSGYVPSATGPTESAFVSFNQAPVANAQSVTTAEDTAKAITLAGSDADGDALTYAIVSQPAHGTLSGTVPNVTYTPAVDYNGSDAFTFKVNDGTVDSAVATVSLTVTAVNDPLVVNAGTDQTVTLGTDVPWTPADLSPAAWYDAADAATITASSGAVSEWQDKSGNGNHATQATSTAQPTTGTRTLNGLNVIDFDGTDDQLLDATFASLSSLNLSIFAVQKHDRLDVQSMTAWGLGRNTSTEGLFFHSSYNTVFSLGCRYPENTNVYYTENTNVELLSYVKAGTSSQEGWVDGVSKGVNSGTVTTFTTERLALGSRFSANYLDGSIGEFIVIPGAVSEEDRQKLEGYLAHKWGLEANLPADHPYKTEAPSASQALATLSDASVTDADGDTPNSTWTVLSAPTGGTAVFDNANLVNPAVSFDTAGEYVLRLTADDGIETGFDEVTVTVNAPQTGEAYEQDAQGLVSIEAEHYTAKTDAADVAWTEITDSAASGGLAMDSAPDDGVAITSDVRMDYRVNFVKTGTHYIWVRGRAWPRTGSVGNADSLHMGLDGPIAGTADNISGFSTSYAWSGSTMDGPVATITVTSTGVHDINVFVREDGFVCDKIVLTTDSGYVPSGTGPAASVLVSLDPVPVAKALSVTTADDTTVTITPSATTDGTPIAWLESFDITSNYDVAAMEDPDGDGALTWEEYQAGTDPTNAASVFRLMTVTTGQGGDHKIVWYGTTNSGVTTEFVVYRCTNLFSDVWVPVSTNARSATGTNTWIGSGASGAAYYRVGF